MSKKEYNEITMAEIIEYAQLFGRTFYRVFNPKEELLEQCFLTASNGYVFRFDRSASYSPKEVIDIFFTFCEKHIDFLRLLRKSHLLYYLLEQFDLILLVTRNIVHGDQNIYQTPLEKKIALLASADTLWNILSGWFQMEERPAPEGISEITPTTTERNKKSRSSP